MDLYYMWLMRSNVANIRMQMKSVHQSNICNLHTVKIKYELGGHHK